MTIEIVEVSEELEMQIQHVLALRKRQRSAHQPTQALAQCVIETFDVGCVPGLFADLVCGGRQTGISTPEIAVADALLISGRQFPPQPPTGGGTAVTNEKGQHLPCPATQDNPDAPWLFFDLDKGKEFIHFQLIGGLA